jgi:feruloyl esterase
LQGKAHESSFYLGCSTGGRQAFKEIQDFPGDFDGVVAGAPAVAFNNLSSWSGSFFLKTGSPGSPTFLTPDMWALVHEDILAQCDTIDGVADGILEDPEMCPYRPEALQCAPGNSTNCLTSPQVQTVRKVFTDLYGEDGDLVFPRMQYGSELSARYTYYTGMPFPYTSDWYRYAIYNNPNWQAANLSVQDMAYAHAKNPSNIETWNGDLSAFKNRGGKVLHYHGLADSIITSENSPRWYNYVSNTMALPSEDLDEFYRFFRIPGMDHCSGGVGAWAIGQNSQDANGTVETPQNNVLMRIVDWVENGNAPVTVTGYKYVNVSYLSGSLLLGDGLRILTTWQDTVSLGVELERNHCKYPLRNMCIDPENYTKPEAWKCVV